MSHIKTVNIRLIKIKPRYLIAPVSLGVFFNAHLNRAKIIPIKSKKTIACNILFNHSIITSDIH